MIYCVADIDMVLVDLGLPYIPSWPLLCNLFASSIVWNRVLLYVVLARVFKA